jgi:hypothetical protein
MFLFSCGYTTPFKTIIEHGVLQHHVVNKQQTEDTVKGHRTE